MVVTLGVVVVDMVVVAVAVADGVRVVRDQDIDINQTTITWKFLFGDCVI